MKHCASRVNALSPNNAPSSNNALSPDASPSATSARGDQPPAPDLRISDDDRQVVIARLTSAFGDGRLQSSEFEERIAGVFEATTHRDLAPLVADLPPPPRPRPSRRTLVRSTLYGSQMLLLAPVICTVIYLLTMPGGYFWPAWVWLGCMIPVATALLAIPLVPKAAVSSSRA